MVLVLGLGVGRRAVALVHVAGAASAAAPRDRPRDGSVHVRLHARSGGRLRAGVLVDVVLGVLLLRAPLALRVVGGAAVGSGSCLVGALLLARALVLVDRLRRRVLG